MAKILLVDDMIDMLREETLLLQESGLGYTIFATDKPDEASRILASERIDLVILDIMMPKKNGFELLHEIKRRFASTKVMIYSAYLEKIPAAQLYQEGADQVLTKPAPLDLFLNSIRYLLEPEKDTTFLIVHGYKIKEIRNQVLAQIIQKVLRKSSSLQTAAEMLGISRECFSQMIKRLGIVR